MAYLPGEERPIRTEKIPGSRSRNTAVIPASWCTAFSKETSYWMDWACRFAVTRIKKLKKIFFICDIYCFLSDSHPEDNYREVCGFSMAHFKSNQITLKFIETDYFNNSLPANIHIIEEMLHLYYGRVPKKIAVEINGKGG